jgi:histidyl-tRNA synthetase
LAGGVTHLSSIGCPACRPALSAALREFFAPKIAGMCEFCQARYQTNPLRILDCKIPDDVAAREGAPSALDHLCPECRDHFTGVRSLLDALGVLYEVDPTIVRGLDYYTRTAFEVIHPGLGAKDVIMGGGRYDGLAEMLGGKPTPGIGFGSGMERMLLALEAGEIRSAGACSCQDKNGGHGSVGQERIYRPVAPCPDIYVAAASPEVRETALQLAIVLRRSSFAVEMDYSGRTLKTQMKDADHLGVRWVALLGEDELAAGTVTLRDMKTGEQLATPRASLPETLWLRKNDRSEDNE